MINRDVGPAAVGGKGLNVRQRTAKTGSRRLFRRCTGTVQSVQFGCTRKGSGIGEVFQFAVQDERPTEVDGHRHHTHQEGQSEGDIDEDAARPTFVET